MQAMADQGSGGAYEISQRMTAMVGWGATTNFQEDWTWNQAADTYALDQAMADKLRKNNPQVCLTALWCLLLFHHQVVSLRSARSDYVKYVLCLLVWNTNHFLGHTVVCIDTMRQVLTDSAKLIREVAPNVCYSLVTGVGLQKYKMRLRRLKCQAGVQECTEEDVGGIRQRHVECQPG